MMITRFNFFFLFSMLSGLLVSWQSYSEEAAEESPEASEKTVTPPASPALEDKDWSYSSGLNKRPWGPNANRAPKHMEPYDLETQHTSKELRPGYELPIEDLKPTAKESLFGLRQSVNNMKDKIFQSKAQIYEWQKQESKRLQRSVSNTLEKQFSRISLNHLDRMSALYDLVSLTYYLDGQKIYTFQQEAERELSSLSTQLVVSSTQSSLKIYDGLLPPGKHTLSIHAIYQGNGEGVFRYLNDYRVRVVDEKNFMTGAGENYGVTVTSFEKGRFYTSFRERPAFQLDVVQK